MFCLQSKNHLSSPAFSLAAWALALALLLPTVSHAQLADQVREEAEAANEEAETTRPKITPPVVEIRDGHVILLGDAVVRIWGVQIPEIGLGGEVARKAIDELLYEQEIRCTQISRQAQIVTATCKLGDGSDVGKTIIQSGLGVLRRIETFGTQLGNQYHEAEHNAMNKGLGLWSEDRLVADRGIMGLFDDFLVPFFGVLLGAIAGFMGSMAASGGKKK